MVKGDSPIVSSFGDKKVIAHEFAKSARISTYLFCIVAGPYDVLEPEEDKKHP